jgi:hypothetical protein
VPRLDLGLTEFPDHIRKLIEQVREGFARQRYFSNAMNKPGVCYSASFNGGASLLTMYVWLAVDMWSAGMILLFFLARKFPFFQSNDDVEALLEIACIIGRRRMEKAATLHCERLPEARTVPYINSALQPGRSPRIFHRLQQKGNPGANS